MGELHFVHSQYLTAAAISVAAVFLLYIRYAWRRSGALAWASRTMRGRVYGTARFMAYGLLATAVGGLVALLLLQPFLRTRSYVTKYEPVHIVIAMDASLSMLAQTGMDPCGPSRLQMAKQELNNFLDLLRRQGTDKIGLVVFTRFGYQMVPLLTDDYRLVGRLVGEFGHAEIASGMLLSGTNHWDAVLKSVQLFEPDSGAQRILIILTDGEPDGPEEILAESRTQALSALSASGGTGVYVLGIGIPYELFPIPSKRDARGCPEEYMVQTEGDEAGRLVLTSMDRIFLRMMTQELGGEYWNAYDGDELKNAMRAIVERTRIPESREIQYADRDLSRELLITLMAALLLLVIVKSP
ncbi:MAG TPA: VWA domain-containing protein [Candidatus Paceibacterota bacterium]|nr:VWA domain-containing protein [Candidatus Paceibacterota bacterium]